MSFQQALSGLNVASKNLDVIGNNIANATTVGFKSSQAQFSDVFASSITGGGGVQVGIGTQLSTVVQQFTQGTITSTSNPLDVAINGNGFFRVSNNGTIFYTRAGQFQVDKNGNLVTSQGHNITGYGASTTGVINTGSIVNITLPTGAIAPAATTTGNMGLNLDSRATGISAAFNSSDSTTYNSSTSMTIYDSLGNSHVYSLYFAKDASTSNTWNVYGTVTNTGGTTTNLGLLTTLGFNSTGALTSGGTATESIATTDLGTGASAISLAMNFANSTQYGTDFGVNNLTQDGYASGGLTGFSIGADGVITANYSNGQSVARGQLILVGFTNPQGLQPRGGNLYEETSASGAALPGAPGAGNLGVLQASAIEDSNVDLTAELVTMITAQRNYQANAQSIKTQDQVMQTLVNLR